MAKGSDIFRGIIDGARKQILLDYERSSAFGHSGIKGDERAAAFADFLRDRLPDFLEVTKGEAIDCYDHRTGELDILIYDKLSARPISQQRENTLIPCETLYAVIEVKSLLNKEEIGKCLKHSKLVRGLKPFKQKFVDARTHGAAADKGSYRCLYIVVSYATDIGRENWQEKEYGRLLECAKENNLSPNAIDRIFVADRGMINPIRAQGKVIEKNPEFLLAELFIHLVEFIERERSRRPVMEWDSYALPERTGWRRIRKSATVPGE